ncbi:RNA polymerase III subunit Rpc25-domain-containing protein [Pavlovales sp. CCMP2436]|nr:RNA polymerase III subunit Rpc25-domain-containing protein [Pavlovales sp. CCMP2436]|mmetsp:Transcript_14256/g.36268  ORF Transcript_14256/g.36268 Transcript_14256/m.36268 type:complete len:283 (+) Transcript_14256:70-918(+)
MFSLVKVEDTVKIQPSEFHLPTHEAVVSAVNCKYANKVILDIGLCLQLYDVVKVGDAALHPGSAAQHVAVVFRMVVFRPFIGEILEGTIKSSSRAGVVVTLNFFDDILVPPELMRQPVVFDEAEKVWCWKFNGNEYFMDDKETIRFRVAEIQFNNSNTFVDGQATAALAASAAPSTLALGAAPFSQINGGPGRGGGAVVAGLPPHAAAVAGRGLGAAGGVHPAVAGRGGGAMGAVQTQPVGGRGGAGSAAAHVIESAPYVSPMIVKGALIDDGLGLTSWWND